MRIELKSAEFFLKENFPLSLRSAKNVQLACTEGTLWITVASQPEDIFLTVGQRYLIESDALILVESIGCGKVRLERPRRFVRFKQPLKQALRRLALWSSGNLKLSSIQFEA